MPWQLVEQDNSNDDAEQRALDQLEDQLNQMDQNHLVQSMGFTADLKSAEELAPQTEPDHEQKPKRATASSASRSRK